MEILYKNKKVEKIIADDKELHKRLGNILSQYVKQRIIELSLAKNFYLYKEMGYGKPHPLNNRDGDYAIHLNGNFRLIIAPLTTDLSNTGLKECIKIEIKGVVEYHSKKYEWKIP